MFQINLLCVLISNFLASYTTSFLGDPCIYNNQSPTVTLTFNCSSFTSFSNQPTTLSDSCRHQNESPTVTVKSGSHQFLIYSANIPNQLASSSCTHHNENPTLTLKFNSSPVHPFLHAVSVQPSHSCVCQFELYTNIQPDTSVPTFCNVDSRFYFTFSPPLHDLCSG